MTIALTGLICLAWIGVFGRHAFAGEAPSSEPRRVVDSWLLCSSVLAIVVGFGCWSLLLRHLAHVQQPYRVWFSALPLLAVDDRGPFYNHASSWWLAESIAVLQTLGLCGLFFALRDRILGARAWALLAMGFAAMTAIALWSSAISSFDMYAYAGDAHLGILEGYAPPDVAFSGDWALVNRLYGTPIVSSPYGPVWLGIAYVATHVTTSLGGALFALRLIGLVALVSCVVSLARLGVRPHVLALFALNPALFASFVLDAHNDLVAVAFVLAAAAVRGRWSWIAIVIAACAGAVKLPFLAIAPLAFVAEPSLGRRLCFSASTMLGGIAISLFFGGMRYIDALHATATVYRSALGAPSTNLWRFVLAATVIIGIAWALTARRFVPTLSWGFVAFGVALFGWYLAWGIPYAVAERRWLPAYLVSLPQLSYVMLTIFADSFPKVLVFDATFVLAPALAYVVLRRMRTRGATFSYRT